MGEFNVEKGIPIPNCGGDNIVRVIKEMEIGDSILCKNAGRAGNITFAMRRHGMKGKTLTVENGVRVWRIE